MHNIGTEVFQHMCVGFQLSLHCFAAVLDAFVDLARLAVHLSEVKISLSKVGLHLLTVAEHPFLFDCVSLRASVQPVV